MAPVCGLLRDLPMKRPKPCGVSGFEELSDCWLTRVSAAAEAADGDRRRRLNLSVVNGRICSCPNWPEPRAQRRNPELIRNNPRPFGCFRCTRPRLATPWIGVAVITA